MRQIKLVVQDDFFPAVGTFLQGGFEMRYEKLVEILGKPTDKEYTDKSDCHWTILLPSGKIVTVYNYKDGINYLGRKHGLKKAQLTNWHIGGHNSDSFKEFCSLMEKGIKYEIL